MGEKDKKSNKKTKNNRSEKLFKYPYTNRELSWLDFNERVLEEAFKVKNPPFERLKFLAITASNLDEFFMVRVAGLMEQTNLGYKEPNQSGLTPQAQLSKIREKVLGFYRLQYVCLFDSILAELELNNIFILKTSSLNEEQKKHIDNYFNRVLFPVLTPLAVDENRPFPFLYNKTLNIAVRIKDEGKTYYAVIPAPSNMPRFVETPCESGRAFVMIEDIIKSHMPALFEPRKIESTATFRITRNADLTINEDAEDLLDEMEKSIKKRKKGKPVRLEIDIDCDEEMRSFLTSVLKVKKDSIYVCEGPIDLTSWSKFAFLKGYKRLLLPPITPSPAGDFWRCEDYFEAIRQKDRLVHHPYESFDCVINFLSQAADDPDVLAIKHTLYRVSGNSPVIAALMRAAANGKQVTALIELKARFDEENNIQFAKKMERAGCHVIYGVKGLKTHCKVLLVVRRENGLIRRYLHLGTGNYNENTARLYTDIGMFTCREDFGEDASLLFNELTGYSINPKYKRMIVAPDDMRKAFDSLIKNEIENSKRGLKSGITVKINSLVDNKMIKRMYDVSRAGAPVKMIVRGICSLVPQIPKISENIQVKSIVGQLLEHSRIFKFENAGDPLYFLGSADWMTRNLDRRVEIVFPVVDEDLKKRINDILNLTLADNVNARYQNGNAVYTHADTFGDERDINSQLELARLAKERIDELEAMEKNSADSENSIESGNKMEEQKIEKNRFTH